MLSSIHPFGERSRNNRFWLTATAHTVGSVLGGMTLGTLVGLLGTATTLIWSAQSPGRALVLAAAAVASAALVVTGRERSLPSRTRQVDENWIQQYRGWVYGGGFGFELGFGVSTIITTPLVHVMLFSMVMAGSVAGSVLIGATFGLVRGAVVLTAFRVDSPERLRNLHRRLDLMRDRARAFSTGALVVAGAVGLSAVIA